MLFKENKLILTKALAIFLSVQISSSNLLGMTDQSCMKVFNSDKYHDEDSLIQKAIDFVQKRNRESEQQFIRQYGSINDVEPYRNVQNSKIVHFFPFMNAKSILLYGVLSYAETVSTRNRPVARLKVDPDNLGLNLSFSNPSDRKMLPKFSYLVLLDRPAEVGFGKMRNSYTNFYGSICGVVNDAVKHRSFWGYEMPTQYFGFNIALKNPAKMGAAHLEAATLGPLTANDFDYFLIRSWVVKGLEENISKRLEPDLNPKSEQNLYEEFLQLAGRLGKPVYVGDVAQNLAPLDSGEFAVPKGRLLNAKYLLPKDKALTLQQLRKELNVGEVDSAQVEKMNQIFKKELSLEQQIKNYESAVSEKSKNEEFY